MSLGKYVFLVAAFVSGSLGAVRLLAALDGAAWSAVWTGALLAALNTVAAHGLALWGQARSDNAFMAAVLGGMMVRLGIVLGALFAALSVLNLPTLPLAGSLLGYFSLFLFVELGLIHRRRLQRQEA